MSGAARGVGEATARRFVAEGARVVLGDVTDELGAEVARSFGDAARYTHLDVTVEDDWARVCASVQAHERRLDVLVNNAGILRFGSLLGTSPDVFLEVVRVNQLGPFLGMRAAVPLLIDAGGGSIVNVSSTQGIEGYPGLVAYVASKFALRGMTKTAALELAVHGVRVNSVHPTGIDTPMLAEAWSTLGGEQAQRTRRPASRSGGCADPRRSRRSSASSPPTSRRSAPAPSSSSTVAAPGPSRPATPRSRAGPARRFVGSGRWSPPACGPRRGRVLASAHPAPTRPAPDRARRRQRRPRARPGVPRRAGVRGLGGPDLAGGLRRPGLECRGRHRHRRGAGPLRRPGPVPVPGRTPRDRPDPRGPRHPGAASPLAAGHRGGDRDLVSAVLRARCRLRPGERRHPRRTRRGQLAGHRPEGVEQPRRVRHAWLPPRPHRPERRQARRDHRVRSRHGDARRRGPAAAPDERGRPLQRGVPRRCGHRRRRPHRRRRRRLGRGPHGARQRAGRVEHDGDRQRGLLVPAHEPRPRRRAGPKTRSWQTGWWPRTSPARWRA